MSKKTPGHRINLDHLPTSEELLTEMLDNVEQDGIITSEEVKNFAEQLEKEQQASFATLKQQNRFPEPELVEKDIRENAGNHLEAIGLTVSDTVKKQFADILSKHTNRQNRAAFDLDNDGIVSSTELSRAVTEIEKYSGNVDQSLLIKTVENAGLTFSPESLEHLKNNLVTLPRTNVDSGKLR